MKIDVHTHIMPARIADRVLQSMARMSPRKALYKNTVAAIKAHMREAGADTSIVLGWRKRPGTYGQPTTGSSASPMSH
jgi:hypothetical protein